jgi:hypothetical protein
VIRFLAGLGAAVSCAALLGLLVIAVWWSFKNLPQHEDGSL